MGFCVVGFCDCVRPYSVVEAISPHDWDAREREGRRDWGLIVPFEVINEALPLKVSVTSRCI